MNSLLLLSSLLFLTPSSSPEHIKADHLLLSKKVIVGEATDIAMRLKDKPAPGVELQAHYRSNAHAALQHQQNLGRSDAQGLIHWTPKEAGVVVLKWNGGQHNVSVFYDGVPFSGVLVAVLAGLLLIGGTIFFFAQMLRSKED